MLISLCVCYSSYWCFIFGFNARVFLAFGFLHNSHCNSLLHVSDRESAQRWVLRKGLDYHWLRRHELDERSVAVLERLRVLFDNKAGSSVGFRLDLVKRASHVGSVAVENRRVALMDLTWVVHNHDLSSEPLCVFARIVLRIRGNEATTNLGDGDTFDVETYIVTWERLTEGLVMHLDALAVGSDSDRPERDLHAWLQYPALNSSSWYGSYSLDLVTVLDRYPERLVRRPLWLPEVIKTLQESLSLIPGHVGRLLNDVIASPPRNGHKGNLCLVPNLFEVVADFHLDVFEPLLAPVGGVHLSHAANQLLNSHREGQQRVLTSLPVLRPPSFEFALRSRDH